MMTELLPCPFCGSTPILRDQTGTRFPPFDVICRGKIDKSNCQCHLWPSSSAEEAIAAWNTRAALSAERERAKGLVELLKAWVCMYEDKNEVPGEARVMAWAASIQALAAYEQQCIENAEK